MKITNEDIRRLRWPLVAAVLLVVAGIGTMVVSENYVSAAKEYRKGTQAKRTTAQERVARAAEEEKEIRANLVYYRRMVESGIVGPKDRLDLVEKIAAIKTSRKLFEIKYNISPQRALEYQGLKPTGAMDFVNSPMHLDMTLLHEDDLLNFLADLQASKQTHVVVRHCSLQRLSGLAPIPNVAVPTLKSECNVDLINLIDTKPS